MTATNRNMRNGVVVAGVAALAIGSFVMGRLTLPSPAPGDQTRDAERQIAYWRAPMDPTETYDAPGKSRMGMDLIPVYRNGEQAGATPSTTGNGKILYWRAPMDPTEIYDKPGKSRMGMELIPVFEDERGMESPGVVRIEPATMQNMGIRTAPVRRMDFNRSIRTVGKIEYNEASLHTVNTKVSGWIEKLSVSFEGEFVRKGEPLLEIYSPELVTTQEEFILALRNRALLQSAGYAPAVKDADRLVESTRKRLEYWDIPKSEIDRLTETQAAKKTILLRSPATGMVVSKRASEGSFVKAGVDLFEIVDLSTVWVHASLYDYEVPWITEGQSAEMELSYLPGKRYRGHVSFIYPYLREQARDVHVRLVFQNPNLDLKPGMFVTIQFAGRTIKNALVIPSGAVIRSGERAVVFVPRGEGRFEPRVIQIGEEGGPDNSDVRVLSGLQDGDSVVTSAQFMLDSESRLQEAIDKMLREREAKSSSNISMPSGT